MRIYARMIAVAAIVFGVFTTAYAAPKYWVGSAANPTPTGVWDTATTPNWNDAADGPGSAATWADFASAFFSAGAGATGTYTVNVSGTQVIGSVATDGIFF